MVTLLQLGALRVFLIGIIFSFLCLTYPSLTCSWNLTGHQLAVQMALQELSSVQQERLLSYHRAVGDGISGASLVMAAGWLDQLHHHPMLAQMHYESWSFSEDGTRLKPRKKHQAIWALREAERLLADPKADLADKGIALRILIHVLVDVHQPLHAASRVSHDLPHGDLGGNLFFLNGNSRSANLHAYWDSGGFWLAVAKTQRSSFVAHQAKRLRARWPCDQLKKLEPIEDWVKESHLLARQEVYKLKAHTRPSKEYQSKAQEISQERIRISSCRLAAVLKSLIDSD